MTFAPFDPAILTALTDKIGHAAPFTDAELQAITALRITGAKDLAALAACTGLTELAIIGSDISDLAFCANLPHLAHLQILATLVASLAGLAACQTLERLDLLYTSASNATEILALPAWRRGTLIGNPWDAPSWEALQAAAAKPGMLLELPMGYEWKQTVELWEKYQATVGPIAHSAHFFIRPGLPALTQNAFDAVALHSSWVSHLTKQPDFSMAETFGGAAVTPDLPALAMARTLGTSADAEGWIAHPPFPESWDFNLSSAQEKREMMTRFVQRFPSVLFYRTSEELVARETPENFALPDWYRKMRLTLDGFMPNQRGASIELADFYSDHAPRGTVRFYLGLYPHAPDYEAVMQKAGYVNVGMCVTDNQFMLAMKLGDADQRIFQYHFADISDAVSEKRKIDGYFSVAFRSWERMLDRVVALHPHTGEPVQAVGPAMVD